MNLKCGLCWVAGLLFMPLQGSAQDLSAAPQWQALLHFDGGRSRVDAQGFFLHPDGRSDAQLELSATVQAMLANAKVRCKFPARFRFLQQHVAQLAGLQLPVCEQYQSWRDRLQPESASLVFASAYLGNPSSMFGHSFLRLDRGASPLLAWAVNFAAQTQDPLGFKFAWKGATGGYPGRFGLAPYYDKITEYAQLEQRDLWEYPLRLSVAELDFLLAHLWEMRESWFDYFFFQENCSFQLLALLQVVKPNLNLTGGFGLFAAPIDTLRRLRRFDLLATPKWRPAAPSALRNRISELDDAQQHWIAESLREQRLGPSPSPSAQALELLAELAEYRSKQHAEAGWISLRKRALQRRSELPASNALPAYPPASSPDRSHNTQRATLGMTRTNSDNLVLMGWRPVLHDALDMAAGLPRGSEIGVLNTRLSAEKSTLRLEQLSVFEVSALPLRDRWFQPASWQLALGYRRDEFSRLGLLRAEAGFGRTYGFKSLAHLRHSYLLRGALIWGKAGRRALESTLLAKLQGQWSSILPWRLRLSLRRRDGLIDDAHQWRAFAEFGQQWQFDSAWALRAQLRHEHQAGQSEAELALVHYF